MDEYLQYDDPGDDLKFDEIAYPTHIPKTYAYELGVIVSDGIDIVEDQAVFDEDVEALATELENSFVPPDPPIGSRDGEGYQRATAAGQQTDAACNIPPSGAVPLLERPKAVACRWKKTMEKPAEFQFSVSVEWELLQDIADGEGPLQEWFQKELENKREGLEDQRNDIEDDP